MCCGCGMCAVFKDGEFLCIPPNHYGLYWTYHEKVLFENDEANLPN